MARPAPEHRQGRSGWFLVVLGFAYLVLRAVEFGNVVGDVPAVHPDSSDYEYVASLSLWDPSFWTWWKPWGLPLLYKLLPGSVAGSVPVTQWLFAAGCWLTLAFVVASFVRQGLLRVVGFAAVLAFSLTPLVAQWDGVLLTESVSASLTALLVAALLVFVRSPRWWNAVLVIGTALLASAVRDTNAWMALFLVAPLGVVVASRGFRTLGATVAGAAVLVIAWNVWSVNVQRWETPMQSVIAENVIDEPTALDYFVARGMPVRPGLQDALLSTRIPPSQFDAEPALAYFRPWFEDRARSTYLSYLVSHPSVSLGEPLRNFDLLIAPKRSLPYGLDYFRPPGFRDALPGPIAGVLYSQKGWLVGAAMLLAGACALVFWRLGDAERFWLVPAFGLIATVPLALMVWNSDPRGIDRHALPVGLVGRLSLILLVLFMLDAVLARPRLGRARVSIR